MADAATKIFELQDEIERLLRKSDLSLLENIAFAINIEEEVIHGKNKQQVLIQEVFDSVEDTSEKLVVFSNLVSLIPSEIKDKYTELLMPLLRNPMGPYEEEEDWSTTSETSSAEEEDSSREDKNKLEENIVLSKTGKKSVPKFSTPLNAKLSGNRYAKMGGAPNLATSKKTPRHKQGKRDTPDMTLPQDVTNTIEIMKALGLAGLGKKELKLQGIVGGKKETRMDTTVCVLKYRKQRRKDIRTKKSHLQLDAQWRKDLNYEAIKTS